MLGHTPTHPFNGPFSGTTHVSRHQKGKTSLDFTEANDSGISRTQVCTSLETDSHASTPPLSFLQAPFLLPNKQRQSTEGPMSKWDLINNIH